MSVLVAEAIVLCSAGYLFFNAYSQIYSASSDVKDKKAQAPTSQENRVEIRLKKQETEAQKEGVTQPNIVENDKVTVVDIGFGKERSNIEQIKYLSSGVKQLVTGLEDNEDLGSKYYEKYLGISTLLGGKVKFEKEDKIYTTDLVYIHYNSYDMYSDLYVIPSFYYEDTLYIFSLRTDGDNNIHLNPTHQEDYLYYPLLTITEVLKKNKQGKDLVFNKVGLSSELFKSLPPSTVALSGKDYFLVKGAVTQDCWEGGVTFYNFIDRATFLSNEKCYVITELEDKKNGYTFFTFQPRYPYDIDEDDEGIYGVIRETQEKFYTFRFRTKVDGDRRDDYRGCFYDCSKFEDYIYTKGPGGLLYSYHQAK